MHLLVIRRLSLIPILQVDMLEECHYQRRKIQTQQQRRIRKITNNNNAGLDVVVENIMIYRETSINKIN